MCWPTPRRGDARHRQAEACLLRFVACTAWRGAACTEPHAAPRELTSTGWLVAVSGGNNMADDKLEPRLRALIDEQKVRASARGVSVAEVEEQQSVQVTISHQEDVRALEGQLGEGQARQAALASLEHKVHELQAPVLAKLAEVGVEPDRQHVLTNAVTATLTPAQIRQVAELDEVKLVRLESFDQVTTMNESVEVIEAREVWDQLGFNGRGIRVAVLDTGIDENHPALLGKVVDRVSTAGESITIPGAHGTHTAGTVASNDPIYRGVAWQADLINIKVLTAGGSGQPQSVIDGLDQAVRRNALVASPHVAGVAALILQRFPDASPMMVKKHLEDTSEVLPYAPNEAGYGLVNAFGAMIHTLTVK